MTDYDDGYADGASAERARSVAILLREGTMRGPTVRGVLRELADVLVKEPVEGPTMLQCPARDCEGGAVLTREETSSGYRVVTGSCSWCSGTGAVTPRRVVSYRGARK